MKIRIIATLSVISIIAGVGWHQTKHLSELRARQQKAQREAALLGIETGRHDDVIHKTDRPIVPKPPVNKQSVADTMAFIMEFEAAKSRPGNTKEQSNEGYRKLFELFDCLNASQVRQLLAEIDSHEELPEAARKSLGRFAVTSLLRRSPGDGLDLYVETQDQSGEQAGNSEVERALSFWAEKDADAALEWIRRNLTAHPDSINDPAKAKVIAKISTKNRKLAFQLIGELGVETPATATQYIMSAAKTAEERIAAVADLREYLPNIEDKNERFRAGDYALATIGTTLTHDGFDTATQWAISANLTDSELASFGSSFGRAVKDGEQSKWMDWFGERLPNGLCARPIRQVMLYWSEEDYKAAGAWINSAPDGTMKQVAISTYASAVSDFEPEAAVQWAVTLPPGKLRNDTLHKIYHNWPKKDPAGEAAAAAFEKQYQIQHDH